jgi:hypothetical protein
VLDVDGLGLELPLQSVQHVRFHDGHIRIFDQLHLAYAGRTVEICAFKRSASGAGFEVENRTKTKW